MAKNRYPADCQRLINQFAGGAASWAAAADVSIDDVRQAIAIAWLQREDPERVVPAALGIRKLRGRRNDERRRWVAKDPTISRGELQDDAFGNDERLLPLRDARGSLTRGIANDAGIGMRAAQKRLKRQRDAAVRGQGDLFDGGVV